MTSATVPLLHDDTIPFGEEEELGNASNVKLAHPYVSFFHLAFRGAAIVAYILCGWFSDSFITSFVSVILLLSADFWTVKNITGRILVGLRWWNYVDDEGVSHWVFESRKGENYAGKVNGQEARLFWLALILCPVIWGILFIVALFGFKFKWLLLVLIALALNGANLYGYVKCNFGAGSDLQSATTDFVRGQMLKNAVNIMTKPSGPPTSRPTNVV